MGRPKNYSVEQVWEKWEKYLESIQFRLPAVPLYTEFLLFINVSRDWVKDNKSANIQIAFRIIRETCSQTLLRLAIETDWKAGRTNTLLRHLSQTNEEWRENNAGNVSIEDNKLIIDFKNSGTNKID